jgi:hypothetical protein
MHLSIPFALADHPFYEGAVLPASPMESDRGIREPVCPTTANLTIAKANDKRMCKVDNTDRSTHVTPGITCRPPRPQLFTRRENGYNAYMTAGHTGRRLVGITRIVSGGQTGADRAALDFAMRHDIDHGGWVPKGRKAEDGPLPPRYMVRETPTTSYSERTRKNVADSDGTLIVFQKKLSGGTALTHTHAIETQKPVLLVDISDTPLPEGAATVRSWLSSNSINVLTVAGPRECQAPGIYDKTVALLDAVFSELSV